MKTVLQDIRFGIRQLIKMPGFTLTAIVSLALGIGATTAVFSVVYAILMDPYPYKDPDRMIHMRLTVPSGDLRGFGVTGPQWQELRKSPVVEDTFLEDDWNLTVTGGDLARGRARRLSEFEWIQLSWSAGGAGTRIAAIRCD